MNGVKMESICNASVCTGCGMCVSVCPKSAIKLKEKTTTGHFFPEINPELCINCGLCQKKCPANKEIQFAEPETAYAAWREDAQRQKGSSSGGVAAALYEMAIDKGWYIVGTCQNENLVPYLKVTNSPEDIEKFKGSKYVQANPQMVYKEVRDLILEGKTVLFIGTPCQCQAAKSIVDDPDKLYTVELICHGVPSQKVLKDYLSWIESQKNRKVTELSYRTPYGEELTLKSGGRRIWKRKRPDDFYLTGFNDGLILNDACYQCKYAKPERSNDLTIGDFWGIGKQEPFTGPGRKVSVIAVNTVKGRELLKGCDTLVCHKREYKEAVDGNSQLQAPKKKHPQYEEFWSNYRQAGIEAAMKATIYKSVQKRYVVRMMKQFPKDIVKKILRRA